MYKETVSYFLSLLKKGYTVQDAWERHFDKKYGWNNYLQQNEQKVRIIYPNGYENEKFWKNGNINLPIECMPDPDENAIYMYKDFYWVFPDLKE
jgi:hypothetical protein